MSTGSGDNESVEANGRKRKRKSRWGTADISEKLFIPGMPTVLPGNLTKEQEDAYLRESLSSFFCDVSRHSAPTLLSKLTILARNDLAY